jgi:hypothetical protein
MSVGKGLSKPPTAAGGNQISPYTGCAAIVSSADKSQVAFAASSVCDRLAFD